MLILTNIIKIVYINRLCSQTLLLKIKECTQLLISASGCSLSSGWAVSLPGATHLWGLTCPAAPAGVSHLQLLSLVENNNLLEKSLLKIPELHLPFPPYPDEQESIAEPNTIILRIY